MDKRKKTTFTQSYINNEDGFGINWWNENIPLQIKFSSNQIVELNEYRVDLDLKILHLQTELKVLEIEIKKYIERDYADLSKIKELYTQILDIQNQISYARIEARESMNGLCTN